MSDSLMLVGPAEAVSYQRDAWQRSIFFLDTMHRRSLQQGWELLGEVTNEQKAGPVFAVAGRRAS